MAEDRTVNRAGEVVTLKVVVEAARRIRRFSRADFAEDLQLKPIHASKWINKLRERGLVVEDATEFKWKGGPVPDDLGGDPVDETETEVKPEEFERFERLTGGLLNVSKEELDDKRREYDEQRESEAPAGALSMMALLSQTVEKMRSRADALGGVVQQLRDDADELERRGREELTDVDLPMPEPPVDDLPPTEPVIPTKLTVELVRDFAVKQDGPFDSAAAFKELDALIEGDVWHAEVENCMEALEERGIIRNVSPTTDMKLWEHAKATGPGAAAELDIARRPKLSNGGGSMPVAGTGRQPLPPHPEAAALVRELRRAGYAVDPVGSGHWAVVGDGLKRAVNIAGTPSRSRTVTNDRSRLKRAGAKF